MMRNIRTAVLAVTVAAMISVGLAAAAPGDLDPSFGTGGVTTLSVPGSRYEGVSDLVIQPDGKIVVGGAVNWGRGNGRYDFAVYRFRADGAPDPTFGGGDGVATTPVGPGDSVDIAWSIALQPDGKILGAGEANMGAGNGGVNAALVRWRADGTLDPTFGGGDGIVTTPLAPGDNEDFANTHALIVLRNGDILVGGAADVGSDSGDFAVARYHSDGTLDLSFGTNGVATTAFGGGTYDFVSGLALQRNGKIVAVGGRDYPNGDIDHAFARYTRNGAPDNSFGTGGKTTVAVAEGTNRDGPWGGVAIQEDGRIVTGGVVLRGPDNANRDFALVGLRPNGRLDPEFGTGGIVKLAIAPGNQDDVIWKLMLDKQDRILAAGESGGFDTATGDFALARFNEEGQLDSSFGSGGIVITPIGAPDGYNQAYGMAVQRDGRIVLAGECDMGPPTGIDVCAARYKGGGGESN